VHDHNGRHGSLDRDRCAASVPERGPAANEARDEIAYGGTGLTARA
jgi:hypothetical protein